MDARVRYRIEPEGEGTREFDQSGFDLSAPWGDVALQGAETGWGYMLAKLPGVIARIAAANESGIIR